jgi:hypothetical protein
MLWLMRITVVMVVLGTSCWAQSWEAVRGLRAGDSLRVLDAAGKERKGVFVSASPESLSMRTSAGETAFDRAQVRRVRIRSGRKRLRNVLIGAGIGLVAGVIVDQTLGLRFRNESSQDNGLRALTYVAPIAIFGGVGAATGSYRTIYRAP